MASRSQASEATASLIEARGLTKVYGDLVALNNVDFRLRRGEVRALLGSNGAGKSTLIKILTGAVAPTAGGIWLDGKPMPLGRPEETIRRGVACIYQHSNLAPAMTVLDNIFLGRQPTNRFGLLDRKRQRREAVALLSHYGIELDLDTTVGELPTVKQKEVEIAKALALNARALLMDEPTGWLAASDVRRLHETIRQLKSRGVGIVYISHMLDEIFGVCDTMTIMRDGCVIAEADVAAMARSELVRLMVGERLARESGSASAVKRRPRGDGRIRLSVRDYSRNGVFRDVSFDLYAGEIFCLTGLIGSKRTELLRSLFGAEPHDGGRVELDGRPIRPRSPAAAMSAGFGLAPEDRHRDGLMLNLSVTENLVMTILGRFRSRHPADARRHRSQQRPVDRCAGHSSARRTQAGQAPLRRQPAEGSRRQMAQSGATCARARRADGRGRRRRQGRDLRDSARRARSRRRRSDRFLRSRGGHDDRRSHRRHGVGATDRDP